MVNYTPNLNLAKPTLSDVADITVISNNFDILDSALAKMVTTDSPQEITGSKTFSGTVIVNGHNLRNAVTTDETQTITGLKTINRDDVALEISNPTFTKYPSSGEKINQIRFYDKDKANSMMALMSYRRANGDDITVLRHYTANGSARDLRIYDTYMSGTTPSADAPSNALVTKAEVYGTNNLSNNLVHTIGDETKNGMFTFYQKSNRVATGGATTTSTGWYEILDVHSGQSICYKFELISGYNNEQFFYGRFQLNCGGDSARPRLWLIEGCSDVSSYTVSDFRAEKYTVTDENGKTDTRVKVFMNKRNGYLTISGRLNEYIVWGDASHTPASVIWQNKKVDEPTTSTYPTLVNAVKVNSI